MECGDHVTYHFSIAKFLATQINPLFAYVIYGGGRWADDNAGCRPTTQHSLNQLNFWASNKSYNNRSTPPSQRRTKRMPKHNPNAYIIIFNFLVAYTQHHLRNYCRNHQCIRVMISFFLFSLSYHSVELPIRISIIQFFVVVWNADEIVNRTKNEKFFKNQFAVRFYSLHAKSKRNERIIILKFIYINHFLTESLDRHCHLTVLCWG